MKVLSGVKQSGKTTKLLQEANGREDVYIVYRKQEIADNMKLYAKKLGLEVNTVSISDVSRTPLGCQLWIDDFDDILWDMFGKRNIRVAVNECEVKDLNGELAKRMLKEFCNFEA